MNYQSLVEGEKLQCQEQVVEVEDASVELPSIHLYQVELELVQEKAWLVQPGQLQTVAVNR